jgi:sugar lactone lactonase YvrE
VTAFETLASGYGLIEGPRVDADDNLYFSDVTNGGVYKRSPDGSVSTYVPKRRGVGGIAIHADGGLVISGRNVCHVKDGTTRVLFERDDVGGFNDLFTDGQGRVLVGSLRSDPFGGGSDRVPGDLWRIDAGGDAEILYGEVGLTNGIGFSPDGTKLYHSDSAAQHILVHDVGPDGNVGNRAVFAKVETGAPDGLAVDESGCVLTASYGGSCVLRFTPDGTLDAKISVPAEQVTSLCFGGADRRDLYVVTAGNAEDPSRGGTIFRTRTDVPGLPAPLAGV